MIKVWIRKRTFLAHHSLPELGPQCDWILDCCGKEEFWGEDPHAETVQCKGPWMPSCRAYRLDCTGHEKQWQDSRLIFVFYLFILFCTTVNLWWENVFSWRRSFEAEKLGFKRLNHECLSVSRYFFFLDLFILVFKSMLVIRYLKNLKSRWPFYLPLLLFQLFLSLTFSFYLLPSPPFFSSFFFPSFPLLILSPSFSCTSPGNEQRF